MTKLRRGHDNLFYKTSWPFFRNPSQGPVTRQRVNVKGFWSVKTVKDRPSRKYRKCLMARYTARSSRSKALYLPSGGHNCLLKKARAAMPQQYAAAAQPHHKSLS